MQHTNLLARHNITTQHQTEKGLGYEDVENAHLMPPPVFHEESEEEEEEEEEEDEDVHFDEVTEVRFPGEVGPLGDRRLCKIRCVKGRWIGPLCAANDEGNLC